MPAASESDGRAHPLTGHNAQGASAPASAAASAPPGQAERDGGQIPVDRPPGVPAPAAPSETDFDVILFTVTPRLIATPALVVVNVLVFVAMLATGVSLFAPTGQSLVDWGANFGPRTLDGEWWRLASHLFVHGGVVHLACNLWVLWAVGPLVERWVGPVGFVILYFVSGIAGGLARLAWNPATVSVGASGALFGVVGAWLGLLATRRATLPPTVLQQLRHSLAMFLIINVALGVLVPGIDLAAHAGGFVAGIVCGLILSQPLSVEMVARRGRRNLALVGLAAIALPLLAAALPEPPPSVGAQLRQCADREAEIMAVSDALIGRAQRREITEAEFAAAIERDVLPAYAEVRKTVTDLLKLLSPDQSRLLRLEDYMTCRQESWQLQIEGIREQDRAKLDQSRQKWRMADELIRELGARGDHDGVQDRR